MEELIEEIDQLLLEIKELSDNNPVANTLLEEKRKELEALQKIVKDASVVDVSNALNSLRDVTLIYYNDLARFYLIQEKYKNAAEDEMNNILKTVNFQYPVGLYKDVFIDKAISMLYGVTKKGFKINWIHTIINTLESQDSQKRLIAEFNAKSAAIAKEHQKIVENIKKLSDLEITGNHVKKYYIDIGDFIAKSSLENYEKVLMIDRLANKLRDKIDQSQLPAGIALGSKDFDGYLKPLIIRFVNDKCCFHQQYGTLETIGTNVLGQENTVIKTEVDFNKPLYTFLKKDGRPIRRVLTILNRYGITMDNDFLRTEYIKKHFPEVCILNEYNSSVVNKINPERGDRHRQIKEF
jgi:hypothetical protein